MLSIIPYPSHPSSKLARSWWSVSWFWFSSYLSLRSQAVSINESISAFSTLSCGIPRFRIWPTFVQIFLARWSQKILSLIPSVNICFVEHSLHFIGQSIVKFYNRNWCLIANWKFKLQSRARARARTRAEQTLARAVALAHPALVPPLHKSDPSVKESDVFKFNDDDDNYIDQWNLTQNCIK